MHMSLNLAFRNLIATAAFKSLGMTKTTFYEKVKEYEGINV